MSDSSSGSGGGRASRVIQFGSGHLMAKRVISDEGKITAWFGDKLHQKHVVEHFQGINSTVQTYFDGKHQAWWIKRFRPDIIDEFRGEEPGEVPPSVRTLSTVFEIAYQSLVGFRFQYDRWLPKVLLAAPTDENTGMNTTAFGSLIRWMGHVTMDVVQAPKAILIPINPRKPLVDLPPGDTAGQIAYMDRIKFQHGYPELKGYVRNGNGWTAGDNGTWNIGSTADANGDGSLFLEFPARNSPFDTDADGKPAVDGLYHPRHVDKLIGFRVVLISIGNNCVFDEEFYHGIRCITDVPVGRASLGCYIRYKAGPHEDCDFVLYRYVLWNNYWNSVTPPNGGVPEKLKHDDL